MIAPLLSKFYFENGSLSINTGILFGIPLALHHEILDQQKLASWKRLGPNEGLNGRSLLLG